MDLRRQKGLPVDLNDVAMLAGWPTPVSNDDNKSPKAHLAMKARMGGNRTHITSLQVMVKTLADGLMPAGTSAATATGTDTCAPAASRLNPAFSLWLMGFPTAWACCGARVTPSSRRLRRRSCGPTARREG